MGYRSDVAVGIQFPTRDDMVGFFAMLRLHRNKCVADALGEFCEVVSDDHHVVMFTTDGVKWYESYPDVEAMHFVIDQAKEREFATVFMRIGENYDDAEVDFYEPVGFNSVLYDLFTMERSLSFPSDVRLLSFAKSE